MGLFGWGLITILVSHFGRIQRLLRACTAMFRMEFDIRYKSVKIILYKKYRSCIYHNAARRLRPL